MPISKRNVRVLIIFNCLFNQGIVECSTFRWSRLWVVGGDRDGGGGGGFECEEPQSFIWKNQHFIILSESWCWPPSSTENHIFGGRCKFFPSLFRDHFVGKGAPQESLPGVIRVKLATGGNHWRLRIGDLRVLVTRDIALKRVVDVGQTPSSIHVWESAKDDTWRCKYWFEAFGWRAKFAALSGALRPILSQICERSKIGTLG